MAKALELTGKTFYYLKVLNREPNRNGRTYWRCQCKCGNEIIVQGRSLTNGNSKSCGCYKSQRIGEIKKINELGNRYGKLVVIQDGGSNSKGLRYWICKCDCGTITKVSGPQLRSGKTQSCGCLKSKGEEKIAQILSKNNISYSKEKTFDNCRFPKTNRLAKFDFFVNNSYLIEYDGDVHFNCNSNGWNTEKRLLEAKERDIFKNEWCIKNHIPLIRIPYTILKTLELKDLLLETSQFIIKEEI